MSSNAAAVFATVLFGCGSYSTRSVGARSYPGPTELASTVCVVRIVDSPVTTPVPVWDNGVLVGATQGASHFCYAAAPGRHVVTSELLVTARLELNVLPNEYVFVRQEVGRGFQRRRSEYVLLDRMSTQEGASAQAATRRVELTEVPYGEKLPTGGVVRSMEDRG